MTDLVYFIVAMIVTTVGWAAWSLRNESFIEYFKTRDGLGILKGIVLAILFAVILAASSKVFAEDGWFTEGEVFAGIDQTFNPSPMCIRGSVDDKATSNIGIRVNVWESGNFSIRSKYTHHSCAFGEDDSGYDAIGIELVFKLW